MVEFWEGSETVMAKVSESANHAMHRRIDAGEPIRRSAIPRGSGGFLCGVIRRLILGPAAPLARLTLQIPPFLACFSTIV